MGHWDKKNDADTDVPAEIKTAIDKLQRGFEAFKAKNDQELAEVKKKGSADVVVRDEVKKVNAALDELQEEIKSLWKRVSRPALMAKTADNTLELKADAEFAGWLGGVDAAKASGARREYSAAFDRYLRKGDKALQADEVKALTVGSAPDGGYYVEPARADRIIARVFETSAMREVASQITIGSSSVKMPIDRDEVGYEWVGEVSGRSETTTARLGELEIPVHELSAMPKMSQNLLDDAVVNIEEWTNQKIGDRFARGENSSFVNGNGANKPRGFTDYVKAATGDATRAFGTLQYVATGASGDFATTDPSDALIDMIYAMKAAYRANARWAMNRSVQGRIRKFKDGQGNYIWQPNFTAGQPATLLGFPIVEFQDMQDIAANAFPIAFADFRSGYLIVDRQGIRQLRDPFTAKPYVLLYTTKRVGGAVVDSDAIKLLKVASS